MTKIDMFCQNRLRLFKFDQNWHSWSKSIWINQKWLKMMSIFVDYMYIFLLIFVGFGWFYGYLSILVNYFNFCWLLLIMVNYCWFCSMMLILVNYVDFGLWIFLNFCRFWSMLVNYVEFCRLSSILFNCKNFFVTLVNFYLLLSIPSQKTHSQTTQPHKRLTH